MINENRIRILKRAMEGNGPVIYWMSRDQRVSDNWALLFAQQLALEKNRGLEVVFSLVPKFLDATIRQYDFMLNGLMDVEKDLKKLNIPFRLLQGTPVDEILKIVNELDVCNLVSDFDPLSIKRNWKQKIAKKIDIQFYEVDAHNIVPCFYASPKLEFGAYTIRPKIHKNLPLFLDEFPRLKKMKHNLKVSSDFTNWELVYKSLIVNENVKPVNWLKSGEKAAHKTLKVFIDKKFHKYSELRNDPNQNVLSNLSPFLHFGQISAQRIALIINNIVNHPSKDSFLEELIVRRELSDNFCFYNPYYDSFKGFRNAAQKELVTTGKMHGDMRMYWAKKILEWSNSPEDALRIAIYLNDKYELDGRDPNGYVGCAWAIGGLHDRAWKERPVFGKIRYMNRKGAKRKFDIEKYISNNSQI
ncbi:MAG: deoxyribodipyrimidine photo-lyase [Ignavibacteriaceae bacterium]